MEVGLGNGHKPFFTAHGSSGGVGCSTCGLHDRMRTAWSWIGAECQGAGRLQGHKTVHIHGLNYCRVCGRYDATGKSRHLKQQCSGQATAHGLRVLSRIRGEPPRPPIGLRWPDGATAENALQRRCGGRSRRSTKSTVALTRRTAKKRAGTLRTRPAREGAVSCPPKVQGNRTLTRHQREPPKAPQRRLLDRIRAGVLNRQEAEAGNREPEQHAIVSLEPCRANAPASSSSPRPGPEVRPGRAEKRRWIEPSGQGQPFAQQAEPSPAAVRMQQLRARIMAKEAAAAAARSSTEDAA